MSESCDAHTGMNVLDVLPMMEEPLLLTDLNATSFKNTIGYAINLLNHILLLLITVALSWKCFEFKLQKTALHAFLCTLGFVLIFAEAMMVRYAGNVFTNAYDAQTKTILHFTLLFVGGLLGVAGTVQKSIAKERHFRSLHGKFGLAACIFFVVNFIYACIGFSSHKFISPMADSFIHNFLCFFTFVTAMLCQFYGYNTGFFRRNYTYINSYKFFTIVVFILTALWPLKMLLWQFRQLII